MNKFIIEYLVSWLRNRPALVSLKKEIRAYQFLPDMPLETVLVLLESYSQPDPEVPAEFEIQIICNSKDLQNAKDKAFLIYEDIRYLFGFDLPVPNPIPQNGIGANLEPLRITKLEVGSIRLQGSVSNGEFRYLINLTIG